MVFWERIIIIEGQKLMSAAGNINNFGFIYIIKTDKCIRHCHISDTHQGDLSVKCKSTHHFYRVKLGFTGYTYFFLFVIQNITLLSNTFPMFFPWANICYNGPTQ